MDQTILNGGNNTYRGKKLFHGAIMNSGATLPTVPATDSKPQKVFDGIANGTGCGTAQDKVDCLRKVDYNTLLEVQNTYNGDPYSTVNIQFFARPDPASNFFRTSPEVAIANGAFAKVPMIIGNQQDEGTLFALGLSNVTNDAAIETLFRTIAPRATNASLQALLTAYPDDPSIGAPYNTGILNQLYPGFKRIASIVGDVTFIMQRRLMLESVSSQVKAWSYLATYDGIIPFLGTTHATDVLALYYGIAIGVAPQTEGLTRYISFVNHQDPNTIGKRIFGNFYHNWEQWTSESRKMLNFGALGVSDLTDDFREEQFQVIKENIGSVLL
jgi:carboxylesterase type B